MGVQLGQSAALVVPVDQWHMSMRPAQVDGSDTMTPGSDPFWGAVSIPTVKRIHEVTSAEFDLAPDQSLIHRF